jgi:hypothetical protein
LTNHRKDEMNRRRGLAAVIVGAISMALVLSLAGGAATAKKKKVIKLTANMSGQQEVPPHDEGTGKAKLKLKKKKGKVCYDVRFEGIGNATVAHIHEGEKGVAGPPIITLFEGGDIPSPQKACVEAEKPDIKAIVKEPKGYYVNVHTDGHPDGAIRGQLKKKK